MLRRLSLKFLLVGLLYVDSAAQAAPKQILALGDSLTEGYGVPAEASYPAQLQKKLQAQGFKDVTVLNGGVSGATTSAAETRLKWYLKAKKKPDILILCYGGNDGLRGLPTEKSRENLAGVIKLAQKENIVVILAGMMIPTNYGKEYSSRFAKIYPELASTFKLPFLPFLLDKVAMDPKLNLPDGIHPNEKGYQIVADNILPLVTKALQK